MIRPALAHDELIKLAGDGTLTGLSTERACEIIDVAVRDGDCLVHLDDSDSPDGFVITNRRSFFGRDFIKLVIVGPSHRRRGVGSSLVAAALNATTTDRTFISTNESNLAMRALLERGGWQKSGVLDGIDDADPEWVYWRANHPLR